MNQTAIKPGKERGEKRIILHVGAPKTGSSAIQCYFAENKEYLEKQGIGYYTPETDFDPWVGWANGSFLCADALVKLGEPKDEFRRNWLRKNRSLDEFRISLDQKKTARLDDEKKRFKAYCEKFDTVIISDEILWHYEIFYDDFWTVVRDYLSECSGGIAGITAVLYLRRQDRWMLSKWKEDMTNMIELPLDFDEDLQEHEAIGYLDYYAGVKRLEDAFGRENIIVRCAERKSLKDRDAVSDFTDACGIKADVAPESGGVYDVNASISAEIAYAMCEINRRGLRKRYNYHHRAATLVMENTFVRRRGKIYSQTQSVDERKALVAKYKIGNKKISDMYLGGKSIFDDEYEEGRCIGPNKLRDNVNIVHMMVKEQYTLCKERIYYYLQLLVSPHK